MVKAPKLPIFIAALSAMILVALAGCGGQSSPLPTDASNSPVPGGQEIRVVAKDNAFDPKSYTAAAGKPLRIIAVNEGQNVHEVEVKGLLPESKLTPGQDKVIDIQTLAPGTYRIYCEIHEDQGMEGELVVK